MPSVLLGKTAKLMETKYSRASEIIHKDTYVDDTISKEKDQVTFNKSIKELQALFKVGGFEYKGITQSGADPPSHLSEDGVSINVGGYKWFPKIDVLKLNIGPLNFSTRVRGRKDTNELGVIPNNLTRVHCQGKVS